MVHEYTQLSALKRKSSTNWEINFGDWTCDEGLDELEDVVYVVDGQADARGHVKPADSSSNKHELGVIK